MVDVYVMSPCTATTTERAGPPQGVYEAAGTGSSGRRAQHVADRTGHHTRRHPQPSARTRQGERRRGKCTDPPTVADVYSWMGDRLLYTESLFCRDVNSRWMSSRLEEKDLSDSDKLNTSVFLRKLASAGQQDLVRFPLPRISVGPLDPRAPYQGEVRFKALPGTYAGCICIRKDILHTTPEIAKNISFSIHF